MYQEHENAFVRGSPCMCYMFYTFRFTYILIISVWQILPLFLSRQPVMLRSQIKLTSYDFSDLHITGEFDNRPGTGRFLRICLCVVTYRTGAGRRLYMKTSADSWPGTVRRRTCPAGVVRDQPDTVRCPVDFSRIFTCNNEYIVAVIR